MLLAISTVICKQIWDWQRSKEQYWTVNPVGFDGLTYTRRVIRLQDALDTPNVMIDMKRYMSSRVAVHGMSIVSCQNIEPVSMVKVKLKDTDWLTESIFAKGRFVGFLHLSVFKIRFHNIHQNTNFAAWHIYLKLRLSVAIVFLYNFCF